MSGGLALTVACPCVVRAVGQRRRGHLEAGASPEYSGASMYKRFHARIRAVKAARTPLERESRRCNGHGP
jgi:hypothetical protein